MSIRKVLFLLAPLASSACLTTNPEERSSTAEQPINGASSPASQYQLDRAVKIPGCTATRISARFAITALHCQSSVGDTVRFYDTGPGVDSSTSARIEQVIVRPGLTGDGAACADSRSNCVDSSGLFADVALLRLSAGDESDLEGAHATLAWTYPGSGAAGKKVGAGGHDGNSNPTSILLQVSDTLDSSDDSSGGFDSTDDDVDPGDSGGPFYVSSRVVGVLWGKWWVPFDHFNIYTSIPRHLNWILTSIGYAWPGQPSQSNVTYNGSVVQSFFGTELECQYACDKTSSCQAYNYLPPVNSCSLYTGVTRGTAQSGWRSALKHGASSGVSNDVVGYVRSDGFHSVVRTASNGRVHELYLGSNWTAGDIQGSAPGVASKLTAYRRADGVNAVVYRSTGNRIIELALTGPQWTWADLSSWGGETPAGNPVAYVKADGVSAVVYRGASTGHLIELRLGSRAWIATDLSTASGSGVSASSDPSAFVRSDGISSVVFRSGSHIWELFQGADESWGWGVASAARPSRRTRRRRPPVRLYPPRRRQRDRVSQHEQPDHRAVPAVLRLALGPARQLSGGRSDRVCAHRRGRVDPVSLIDKPGHGADQYAMADLEPQRHRGRHHHGDQPRGVSAPRRLQLGAVRDREPPRP
ncbi:MAG: trypsin-like serine protease [Myxococcales bacterium]|nr:trypsin-like serine protease [Myxococcales bacterium]